MGNPCLPGEHQTPTVLIKTMFSKLKVVTLDCESETDKLMAAKENVSSPMERLSCTCVFIHEAATMPQSTSKNRPKGTQHYQNGPALVNAGPAKNFEKGSPPKTGNILSNMES